VAEIAPKKWACLLNIFFGRVGLAGVSYLSSRISFREIFGYLLSSAGSDIPQKNIRDHDRGRVPPK